VLHLQLLEHPHFLAWLTMILRRRRQMLAAGLLTSAEIDQHLADIANSDLDLAAFPVVSAWGRRPLANPG
jgi:hypothetical protein